MKDQSQKNTIAQKIKPFAMILILAVIWIVFNIITGGTFLSMRNISNLFRQMAIVGVLTIAMTICLIAGNFDLSVGSVAGFTGAVTATLVAKHGFNPVAAITIAILVGTAIGFWNGAWIAFAGVPAFIVTLGSQLIFKGCLLLTCGGQSISVRDKLISGIGQGYVPITVGTVLVIVGFIAYVILDILNQKKQNALGVSQKSIQSKLPSYIAGLVVVITFLLVMNSYKGIPIPVFILLVLVVIFSLFMTRTIFGRHVFAVGGNPRAARLSGINNPIITLIVFVIVGMLSGVAGVLTTARLAAATPTGGTGMELDAIAASVIGGVSLSGGSGKIMNSIVGALVMASLTNGMSLLNINSDVQFIVRGLILILAVWFDVIMRRSNDK